MGSTCTILHYRLFPPSLSFSRRLGLSHLGWPGVSRSALSRSVSTLSLAALDIYVFDYRGGPFAVRHWLLHLCTAVLMRPWLNFYLKVEAVPCRRYLPPLPVSAASGQTCFRTLRSSRDALAPRCEILLCCVASNGEDIRSPPLLTPLRLTLLPLTLSPLSEGLSLGHYLRSTIKLITDVGPAGTTCV